MSSIAHVPVARLDTRSMTGVVPKTESKLRWLSKKSRDSRYFVNPPETPEDQTRYILSVEEVGGEVKGSKRFGLGVVILGEGLGGIVVVTLGERLLGPRASIIN